MKMLTLLAGVATLAMTCCSPVSAGGHGLLHLRPFHRGADCGCAQPVASCAMPSCAMPSCAMPSCAMPSCGIPSCAMPLLALPSLALHSLHHHPPLVPPSCAMPSDAMATCAAPAVHVPLAYDAGCHCGAAAGGCCGLGGAAGLAGAYAHSGYGYGGSLTGYEGLPNMDGGGVHNRYPYHSYRRPWAHPGPASTNINIVW